MSRPVYECVIGWLAFYCVVQNETFSLSPLGSLFLLGPEGWHSQPSIRTRVDELTMMLGSEQGPAIKWCLRRKLPARHLYIHAFARLSLVEMSHHHRDSSACAFHLDSHNGFIHSLDPLAHHRSIIQARSIIAFKPVHLCAWSSVLSFFFCILLARLFSNQPVSQHQN